MPAVALPRLALEPLRAECARRDTTINALSRDVGMSSRNVYRRDGISWLQADRFACALGLHPASIWGEDWWAVARAADAASTDARRRERENDRRRQRARAWAGVERSWREWRLGRDRIELHREEWVPA